MRMTMVPGEIREADAPDRVERYQAEYYLAHREERIRKQKEYNNLHKKEIAQRRSEAYARDPEKQRAKSKAYYWANREKIARKNAERKAGIKGA